MCKSWPNCVRVRILALVFLHAQFAAPQVPGLVKRSCVMDYWGFLYDGDESVTKGNRECQQWVTRRAMHKVDPKLVFYQPGAKAKSGNKCRQGFLDDRPVRKLPWCYTVDPKVDREGCTVPVCPERRRGCVTGLCMELHGYSRYGALRPNIEPDYGTGCNMFFGTSYMKLINPYSYPKYLKETGFAGCANPAMGKKHSFGRLSGPWCPIRDFPGSPYRLRWAPCEVPLVGDKELTNPVHYTHAEYENRLMVFWRIRSATVRFWLRAWTDYIKGAAVLYLTEFAGDGVAAVEIIIGYLNKQTKICARANGFVQERCVVKDTFNIVSAEEWREFWVRLEAGMVEFGYAGEGRPLIKTNVDSVGNLAYLATANDQLDPEKQQAKDERRHINMWAFQQDQLATASEDETSVENVYCQEFSTIGPAWYTHLFKMKPLSEEEKKKYLGDIFYDKSVRKWSSFDFERHFAANVWLRANPTGTVIMLSTWPGVSSKYTVNIKIRFDDGKVHVNNHFCDPDKWMAGCKEYPRSRNVKYLELEETKWYMNNSEPLVKLALTKWTRLMIVSQAKIFRIVTFDDVTGQVSGAFSYDLVHFGFMSEGDYKRILNSYEGKREGQKNFFRAYSKEQSKLEAHQFRYIGFGTDGDRRTPPHVSFVRLHCRNGDPTPLTKYPNCLQDTDPISSKFFQGSWSVTDTGEQCTSWSSLLDRWRRIPGDVIPNWGEQEEPRRKAIPGVHQLLERISAGTISATAMDTANNCRNWPGIEGTMCFVRRYGTIPVDKKEPQALKFAASERGYWDVAEPCRPPLCQYSDCRGTFAGQAYRSSNASTGFLPGERCAEVSEISDWDRTKYGDSNLCLNDKSRESLGADRPFCFVKESLDKYVKRFCASAQLCTLNPAHHILASSEVRVVLHSGMQHYTYVGVRSVTPTIRDLGALLCFSDMVWDGRSSTACVYIGNNFFLGIVIQFRRKMNSAQEKWLPALQEAGIFIEMTSQNLAKDQVAPQIEGITFNWYWVKFCSDFVYIGRGQTHTPIMLVPYSANAIRDAGRLRGNRMSAGDWYKYIGALSTGDREPLTGSRPPVKDTATHQSASSAGRRVFSRLLLQGNRNLGTLFAFHPGQLRDLCPIVAIQPKTYPPVSFALNRRRTLEDGATEVIFEFSVRFLQRQTDMKSGFLVRLAEMANGKENGFQVYDIIFTHRRRSDMEGYLPVYSAPAGGEFALTVVQHRPSRDLAYLREQASISRQYGVENGNWFSFGPVLFVNDTADGGWHRLLIRVITDLSGKKPVAKLHVEVPYKDDYRCLFKGQIDGAGVGDVQYASFSLLGGTSGAAQVMLDLAGDSCEPPTQDELKPVARDGGWGMWSSWDCSAPCDGGFGSRQRLCNNPEPTLWGHDCPGWHVPRQFGLCNNHKCGTFSDDTRMRMLYTLANDPVSLQLDEGEKFVLRCRTDAYRAAVEQFSLLDTRWLLNGRPWRVDSNRMERQDLDVVVWNASAADTGVFSCLVQPSPDVTGLVALVAVVVRTENVTRRVMTGDQVEFDCLGELLDEVYDDLIHFWYLDGVLYSYMGYRVFPDENHTDLVLPKTDPTDPMEPCYIAVEEIRLLEVNETLMNTMTMRVASDRLSGVWECRVYQPKYQLLWATNWFRLEVVPFDAYRRLTLGPVAQSLVGGVRGTILYSLLGSITGLAALAGGMYWFVRRRQRRIQAQMVLFKQSGLWGQGGETKALLTEDSEGEEGEEEEEEEDEDGGGVLVDAPEQTESEFTSGETEEE